MERILGLDVGTKTIGVAVSDELGYTAQGVEVIRRTCLDEDLARVSKLVEEYGCKKIVVGLPRNMNGTYGPAAELVNAFIGDLSRSVNVPIVTCDERMTTISANRVLLEADVSRSKRKKVIDKVAAAVILQSYLDGASSGLK